MSQIPRIASLARDHTSAIHSSKKKKDNDRAWKPARRGTPRLLVAIENLSAPEWIRGIRLIRPFPFPIS